MKHFFYIILILIPIFGYGQTTSSLSKMLWSRVENCHSMFEDMNDDGKPDFEKIDDSKNGYLKISGGWPTCGCSCSSTVGAFKNQKGEYVLLQSDEVLCSWEKNNSSNKVLKDILPVNFGIKSFISQQIIDKVNKSIFYLDIEIPRVGTDTKVKIELIPFGLKAEGNEIICYEYRENEQNSNCKSLYRLKDIANDIKDNNTIELLLSGDFDKISQTDNNVINKAIGNDFSRFESKEEIQLYLIELKQIYDIYLMLESMELILGWNRQESRFFIKEKGDKPEKVTFKGFLSRNNYWSPMC